jgi:hypothetical protein
MGHSLSNAFFPFENLSHIYLLVREAKYHMILLCQHMSYEVDLMDAIYHQATNRAYHSNSAKHLMQPNQFRQPPPQK